jgi:hypothetical protein
MRSGCDQLEDFPPLRHIAFHAFSPLFSFSGNHRFHYLLSVSTDFRRRRPES